MSSRVDNSTRAPPRLTRENEEADSERNDATKCVTHVGASTYSRSFHSARSV